MNRQPTISRRALVQGAGIAVANFATTRGMPLQAEDKDLLIIDCHAHIYGEDEKKYPTIEKPYRPPQGKGTISHLQQEMKASGVRYVTAIQTSTFYKFDNRFTSDSARDNNDYMVGVVTLDPDNPSSPETLKKYVEQYNVRGMRSIPAQSGRLDDPGVDRLWAMAERLGIVINVLTNRDKRSEIERLVGRHPALNVVIDHCLNLRAGPDLKPTLKDVVALAKLPRVNAKCTFIPTGSADEYPCRDMHDACRTVIDAFGGDRCVWGSDFPCELWCPKVSYAQHLSIFTQELGLDEKTKRGVLGETARRLWLEQKR